MSAIIAHTGPQSRTQRVMTDNGPASQRKRKEDPAEHDGRGNEAGEEDAAQLQLVCRFVLMRTAKISDTKPAKSSIKKKWLCIGAYFRPSATS